MSLKSLSLCAIKLIIELNSSSMRLLWHCVSRGSVLIVQKCLENGLPSPFWKSDLNLGVTVTFPAPEVVKLLRHLIGEMSREELQIAMRLKDAEHFRKSYINPALELQVIERTIPDKRTSSKQMYRI